MHSALKNEEVGLATYEKSIRVSKDEMSKLNLNPADFHGEWNYAITSRNSMNQTGRLNKNNC